MCVNGIPTVLLLGSYGLRGLSGHPKSLSGPELRPLPKIEVETTDERHGETRSG